MDRQELEQVTEGEDLGMLVDDELKFHRQTAVFIEWWITHTYVSSFGQL